MRGTAGRGSGGTRREFLLRLGAATMAVPSIGVIAGCGGGDDDSSNQQTGGDPLGKYRSSGIRVGIVNDPPYSKLTENGEITGFAPDIARAVLSDMGITKIQGVVAQYASLVPGLNADRWDLIGADFSINKERCGQVRFTDPIDADGSAFAVTPGAAPPASLKAAADGGLKIGILQGSYLLASAKKAGVSKSNLVEFPDQTSAIDGMGAHRVDAVLASVSSLREVAKQHPDRITVSAPNSDDPPHGGGFAFSKDSDATALYDAFQRSFRKLRANGKIKAIEDKWDIHLAPEFANVTAEQACSQAT